MDDEVVAIKGGVVLTPVCSDRRADNLGDDELANEDDFQQNVSETEEAPVTETEEAPAKAPRLRPRGSRRRR